VRIWTPCGRGTSLDGHVLNRYSNPSKPLAYHWTVRVADARHEHSWVDVRTDLSVMSTRPT
jgi:hypothetical protein